MYQEEYKRRIITVDTFKRGRGWTWEYQIDGCPIRKGEDRPLPSEEIIRQEAIGAAKFEIDRMT